MNLLETNAQIQDIETNHDLLRYKIGGWCAWPILRFSLAAIASNLTIDTTDIRLTLSERVNQSIRDASCFLHSKHSKVLLLVASSNRVELENDLYKDIIFDGLLRYIPSYFKIEHINNKFYLDHSYSALYPSQMTTSGIYLVASTLSKLIQPKPIILLADNLYSLIKDVLQISNLERMYIRKALLSYYWRKNLYRTLLRRIKPHILLLQTAYTNHAIVAAAKELNIRVIEFQHGIIDRHHPGYSWTATASNYKKHMPIPDQVFVYGDYWRDELSMNGFWNEEICVVGSLHLDQYRTHKDTNQYIRSNRFLTSRKIVVTTQAMDVDHLISFLIEFIKSSAQPIEIDIKLHPRESDRQPYEIAFKDYPNIRIISGHTPPSTFELLSKADYHVSIHSTCHYDALGLGKPTIILPFTNYERMLPLMEKAPGYTFLVRTAAEMNQIIAYDRPVPQEIGAYYFRNGALENIIHELHLEERIGS